MKQGFRALVVDDDDFSRATAVQILSRLGAIHVAEAADGDTALALADKHGDVIDLVLCDLRMPQLDGIETLGGLAQRSPSAMFVLASGAEPRLLRAAATSARHAGIDGLRVLSKPLSLAKMRDVLASMQAQRSAQPDLRNAAPVRHKFCADDIKRGFAAGEFTPFYQPKISVRTHQVCGAEALMRWHHPTHGLLLAGAFMPCVQANNLLGEVLAVGLPHAVTDCARWIAGGYTGTVSINLPTASLLMRDLPNYLENFVSDRGLPPERVVFEVTEDSWLRDDDVAREILTRIRLRGFGLSIDDFGTGYSGVQQLLHAPFNELKIDQTFVRSAPVDDDAAIALQSIVTLARQLDLHIVAEGVETQRQWDVVAACGCDEVQGFLISHALPPDEFGYWLAKQTEQGVPLLKASLTS